MCTVVTQKIDFKENDTKIASTTAAYLPTFYVLQPEWLLVSGSSYQYPNCGQQQLHLTWCY
jgi:hypothetical protein